MVDKELERRAEYPELNTLHLETFANITINIDNVNPQKKKMGRRKIIRKIVRFLKTKMRKVRVQTRVKQLNQMQSKQLNQVRVIKLNRTGEIKLNKLKANKRKSQEIRLHISFISNLTSRIYQYYY